MASTYDRTITAIAAVKHTSVERANEIGSQSITRRLMNDGLIERDPEWSGCLRLTEAGYTYLDAIEA